MTCTWCHYNPLTVPHGSSLHLQAQGLESRFHITLSHCHHVISQQNFRLILTIADWKVTVS